MAHNPEVMSCRIILECWNMQMEFWQYIFCSVYQQPWRVSAREMDEIRKRICKFAEEKRANKLFKRLLCPFKYSTSCLRKYDCAKLMNLLLLLASSSSFCEPSVWPRHPYVRRQEVCWARGLHSPLQDCSEIQVKRARLGCPKRSVRLLCAVSVVCLLVVCLIAFWFGLFVDYVCLFCICILFVCLFGCKRFLCIT